MGSKTPLPAARACTLVATEIETASLVRKYEKSCHDTKIPDPKIHEAARKIEADDSEERFDEALRRLAKSKREPSSTLAKDKHED